jgi:GDP-4-dehydro-6-deoxy-D-mannose reductase
MTRVLVTGVNGFVGKHVVHELQSRGYEIVGLGYDPEVHSQLEGTLEAYYVCDLTDKQSVAALNLTGFDGIISLAGLAKVGPSFSDPSLYNRVNVAVLEVLGDRLVELGLNPRLLAISSGSVYDPAQLMPLTENSKTTGEGSPYAQSKLAMEDAAQRLRSKGLDCIVARPFNHIGPGQEGGFLVPDLYQKIAAAHNASKVLYVGDLSTRRDYTDVRDVVRAYVDLVTAPSLNESLFNVCSGRSIDGQTILQLLLHETGAEDLAIQQDPQLIRPNDPKDLFGSNEHLRKATNWQPSIPLEQTIHDFVSSKSS